MAESEGTNPASECQRSQSAGACQSAEPLGLPTKTSWKKIDSGPARGFEPCWPRVSASARASQTTEPSAGRKPRPRAKTQYMNVSYEYILNRQMIRLNVRWQTRQRQPRRRAIRRRRRASARTKNGQSSRADGGSMGRNALDRENRDASTCVRSRQISRGRLSVPRQWQCHQNTGSRVHRTPLRRGWDCPRSLVLPVCHGLLG